MWVQRNLWFGYSYIMVCLNNHSGDAPSKLNLKPSIHITIWSLIACWFCLEGEVGEIYIYKQSTRDNIFGAFNENPIYNSFNLVMDCSHGKLKMLKNIGGGRNGTNSILNNLGFQCKQTLKFSQMHR